MNFTSPPDKETYINKQCLFNLKINQRLYLELVCWLSYWYSIYSILNRFWLLHTTTVPVFLVHTSQHPALSILKVNDINSYIYEGQVWNVLLSIFESCSTKDCRRNLSKSAWEPVFSQKITNFTDFHYSWSTYILHVSLLHL